MRQVTRQVVPLAARTPIVNHILWWAQRKRARHALDAVGLLPVVTRNLGYTTISDIQAALACGVGDCAPLDRNLERLQALTGFGAVNPGDRFALAHLVLRLRPRRVLEVGTHVGASTASIALALEAVGGNGRLVTVDIEDVNDPERRPWESVGVSLSPRELIQSLGVEHRVEFVTASSLAYLSEDTTRFDLVFLDGDHHAATVYREIPAALERLHAGGVIVLHDYFPRGLPLWSDGMLEPGPWLAVRRLEAEGAGIRAVPLGTLPWPTKCGSNTTSLAVLSNVRAGEL